MASYGAIHRQPNSAKFDSTDQAQASHHSTRKRTAAFALLKYIGIPSSPEAAAVRIIRNFIYFRAYYVLTLWIILFVSLVPRRRLSLILLVAITSVACLYLLLLRLVPNSVVLHKIIDYRLVLALLIMLTVVELVLTRAIIHLLVSLAIGLPIVLVHAVLRVGDDLFVSEEASAASELIPLVHKSEDDISSLHITSTH